MKNSEKNFQDIINHLKNSGYVFQGSEIYGGLANTWDYGHLGSLLAKNIKDFWWNYFITQEENNFSIDSKILLNPKVWEVSGHLSNFSDPLIENKINKKRYRADHIIEKIFPEKDVTKMSKEQMEDLIKNNIFEYDNSKTDWTDIREFNLMFETFQGVLVDSKSKVYLRPETAQGIFINFKNILRSTRSKLPMGVGQIGKSFRNEVTPGNFIFRTREFEQMELEIFCKPEESEKIYNEYIQKEQDFLNLLGIQKDSCRIRHHEAEELAHYSKGTVDIEFLFPFGWGELLGIANRGDFDLTMHSKFSGEKLNYLDPITNEFLIPYVIEPSVGLDRLLLAILTDAYHVDETTEESRVVLKLDKKIAPYKFAILPLTKKQSELARKIFKDLLKNNISATFDESGTIGKRYRRQDAIGTPFSITVDYQTEQDHKVTIRHRDTMLQDRIDISEIENFLK